jgi:hypothetical protein
MGFLLSLHLLLRIRRIRLKTVLFSKMDILMDITCDYTKEFFSIALHICKGFIHGFKVR